MFVNVKDKKGTILNIPYTLYLSQYKDMGMELISNVNIKDTNTKPEQNIEYKDIEPIVEERELNSQGKPRPIPKQARKPIIKP